MSELVHRAFFESSPGETFPSTCWSRILVTDAAGERRSGLELLARDYRVAVQAYLRIACGLDEHQAEESAQDFFTHVIESDWLRRADPARGRFRAFLKESLRNFAADARRRTRALRRGGGVTPQSLTVRDETIEIADERAEDPEAELDRRWRRALVDGALADVRNELEAAGRGRQFEAFSNYFLAADEAIDYRAIGERLGLTSAEVSNALQRTKAAFRLRLRSRVAETVTNPAELALELEWLFGKARE